MLGLQDLTVGQVSGMIAAAVFIIQFLVPIVLPVILLGLLRPRASTVTQTAVSWSVIGRYLHGSLWPLFLRTDSASTLASTKKVVFVSFFKTFMFMLLAVTAIVTPLGLYEGIVAEQAEDNTVFHYIRDKSPMGYGTPPRTNIPWSRVCGVLGIVTPCPNDNNEASIFRNSTYHKVNFTQDWYDSRIPQKVIDVFQSGLLDLGDTVSGPFDIQYRSHVRSVVDDTQRTVIRGPLVDNGTARTVGTYQPLSSLVLSDEILPVEGLIVDMKNGGIGFRNHTAPASRPFGSAWSEDLLFVVPETVCVDTNLTLDFQIARTETEGLLAQAGVFKPEIVDHGGFVNFNRTYLVQEDEDAQADLDLYRRAFLGAWLHNANSMAYMNITNVGNATNKAKNFAYIDSRLGKRFPLYYPDGKTAGSVLMKPNTLSFAGRWGSIFDGTTDWSNQSSYSNVTHNSPSTAPLFPNPFGINPRNWSDINILCRGQGGGDFANISHIVSECNLLYGAPRRKDNNTSSLFDPGSSWTLPMYSCTSTAKATIKTVAFRFNGTNDDLSGLQIISVTEKTYPNEESKPLWGVENTSMHLVDGGPLWGLVAPAKSNELNLTSVRKASLYLPGRRGNLGNENNPGAEFAAEALDMTYKTGILSTFPTVDYSGKVNLAMYKKWQELSRTTATSANIINFIWTDIAANMVVGTKGLQPHEASKRKRDSNASSQAKTPPVINYARRVKYKYVYGIPAFITIALFTVTTLSTIFFALFSGAKLSTMRTFLQHTSAGRFLTSESLARQSSHASPPGCGEPTPSLLDDGYSDSPTHVWVNGAGQQQFTLGTEGWMAPTGAATGFENAKSLTGAAYARVRGEDC